MGVLPPAVDQAGDDAVRVASVADYIAAGQVALYRDTADFEPLQAVKVQEDGLHRIQGRLGLLDR